MHCSLSDKVSHCLCLWCTLQLGTQPSLDLICVESHFSRLCTIWYSLQSLSSTYAISTGGGRQGCSIQIINHIAAQILTILRSTVQPQIYSLFCRRQRSDLIEVHKTLNSFYHIGPKDIFMLQLDSATRGHQMKLFKPRMSRSIGQHFFQLQSNSAME